MAGPGALLVLGGLLALGGAGGGSEIEGDGAPDLEAQLLAAEPLLPHCFTRSLRALLCFWDSDGDPEPERFRLQYRLEQEPWLDCPLRAARRGRRSRFWCALPSAAAVSFVPMELRVLEAGAGPEAEPLHSRTARLERLVLLGPPENVTVGPGGGRGQLCVRWDPPPSPYLEPSLVYELLLRGPGLPPRTVSVPAGRREQRVGALRGGTAVTVRARTRPDGLSYDGFWSPWSRGAKAVTPPDVDPVTLGLSCLLAILVLALGLLGLLGHRRMLQEKLWPPVPGPEREFEGLFSAYGGNFQLWLCHGVGAPWTPPGGTPEAEELPSTVEEVGPPPGKGPPPTDGGDDPPCPPPCASPSPASSFEYTLFDPGSALLTPRGAPPGPPHGSYANVAPLKGAPFKWIDGDPPADGDPPTYVICS